MDKIKQFQETIFPVCGTWGQWGESYLIFKIENEFKGKQGATYKYHLTLKLDEFLSLKGNLERAMKVAI